MKKYPASFNEKTDKSHNCGRKRYYIVFPYLRLGEGEELIERAEDIVNKESYLNYGVLILNSAGKRILEEGIRILEKEEQVNKEEEQVNKEVFA